jgi:hypothetical protein
LRSLAELEVLGVTDAGVIDNATPGKTGTVGVIPAAGEIGAAVTV